MIEDFNVTNQQFLKQYAVLPGLKYLGDLFPRVPLRSTLGCQIPSFQDSRKSPGRTASESLVWSGAEY
ncbi:MAG: hypothetical protein K940chlam3_00731 [Chlamydiae bacterium]|nr:hypothetical protein [Chlamydiota bacterium]